MKVTDQVEVELQFLDNEERIKIATLGTTARLIEAFLVLPRRTYQQFACINFLVTQDEDARTVLRKLDGRVDYLFVDVERKQEIDLMQLAKTTVSHTQIVSYKPNDASVEACDLLLRRYFQEDFSQRRILVIGAGNLGSKLALRWSERNACVDLWSPSVEKLKQVTAGLNAILPAHHTVPIQSLNELPVASSQYDVLVSFLSASAYVPESLAAVVRTGGMAIDGGIHNFTPAFISRAMQLGIDCHRLDVGLGFLHALIGVNPEVSRFFQEVKGEQYYGSSRLVAGGMMGVRGDIIVDQIKSPTQIIGVANGYGGVIREHDYSPADWERIKAIRPLLSG